MSACGSFNGCMQQQQQQQQFSRDASTYLSVVKEAGHVFGTFFFFTRLAEKRYVAVVAYYLVCMNSSVRTWICPVFRYVIDRHHICGWYDWNRKSSAPCQIDRWQKGILRIDLLDHLHFVFFLKPSRYSHSICMKVLNQRASRSYQKKRFALKHAQADVFCGLACVLLRRHRPHKR